MDKKKPNEELYQPRVLAEELTKEPKKIRTIDEMLAAKIERQISKGLQKTKSEEEGNSTENLPIESESNSFDQAINLYQIMKQSLLLEGFSPSIQKIQSFTCDQITEEIFLAIIAKIILQTPRKTADTEELIQNYNKNGVKSIPSGKKREAIEYIEDNFHLIFNQFKHSMDPIKYLESLPMITNETKFLLARNLGMNYAAPSSGLKKICEKFGFSDIQVLAQKISEQTGDRVGVVSMIIEKFSESKEKEFKKLLRTY